jgi:hypothetical protein
VRMLVSAEFADAGTTTCGRSSPPSLESRRRAATHRAAAMASRLQPVWAAMGRRACSKPTVSAWRWSASVISSFTSRSARFDVTKARPGGIDRITRRSDKVFLEHLAGMRAARLIR